MKNLAFVVSAIITLVFSGVFSAYSPSLGKSRKEQITSSVLLSRLYRGGNTPNLVDFMAEFRVKKNLAGKETQDPSALQDFLKGKIYFKTPDKLRVDSVLTVSDMLHGEGFVLISNGENQWIFKNGIDFPLKKGSDPRESSAYLPFYFQHYDEGKKECVLLGEENMSGRIAYVIGIVSPEDAGRDVKKVWVDSQYLVPIRIEFPAYKWRKVRENMVLHDKEYVAVKKKETVKVKLLYKNIRQTSDGRWLPTQIETYEDDVLIQVVYYDKVAVNFNLPDTLFSPQNTSFLAR